MPKDGHYYPNRGFNGVDTSGSLILKYDGFSAVCTGAKDSDSPCYVAIQGEKGYMKIDGKPNMAPNLFIEYADEGSEPVKDAAGAMVRPTISESFVPAPVHHRMTREFQNFAEMIDNKNHLRAKSFEDESLAVMKVLEMVSCR